MDLIKAPEFWTSLAFILVILISSRPLSKALKAWGKRKADSIQNRFTEAKKLVAQAEKLKKQYESAYGRRSSERQKLMHEAEIEIRFLEADSLAQSSDRMKRKSKEVEMRLKMIAEHGRQGIKHQILEHVVRKTKKLLADGKNNNLEDESVGDLTERICKSLNSFESSLK